MIKAKFFSFVLLTLIVLIYASAAFAKNITLAKASTLIPQGWSAIDNDDIKFKKNTTVILNDTGQVIEGVLNSDTYLRPLGWHSLVNDHFYVENTTNFFPSRFFRPFGHSCGVVLPAYGHIRYKGNSTVSFAADGTVIKGTIDHPVIIQIRPDSYGFVRFKDETILSFYADGTIKLGTLDKDTLLRPLGWENNLDSTNAGFIEFKSGSPIIFSENGYVIQGMPKHNTPWHNAPDNNQLNAKTIYIFNTGNAEKVTN